MFVAFGIQHALRMRYINCHLWPVRLYKICSRFLINGAISKNAIEHKTRALIFSTMLSAILLILIRIVRGMINMFNVFHVNYPLFLSDIKET